MEIKESNQFSSYDLNDTVKAELNNNLTIVNEIIRSKRLKHTPEFYILGGAALVFHGLNYKSTLDIDTANRIEKSVKSDIDLFIDDAASEVSILPWKYKTRAKRYRLDLDCIDVYILSKEDLVINKLAAGRRKDIVSINTSGILRDIDCDLIHTIIKEELGTSERDKVVSNLKYVKAG